MRRTLLLLAVMAAAMLAATSLAMAATVTQADGETEVTLDDGFVFVGSETLVDTGDVIAQTGFQETTEVMTDDVFVFHRENPDFTFVEAGDTTVEVNNGNVSLN